MCMEVPVSTAPALRIAVSILISPFISRCLAKLQCPPPLPQSSPKTTLPTAKSLILPIQYPKPSHSSLNPSLPPSSQPNLSSPTPLPRQNNNRGQTYQPNYAESPSKPPSAPTSQTHPSPQTTSSNQSPHYSPSPPNPLPQ